MGNAIKTNALLGLLSALLLVVGGAVIMYTANMLKWGMIFGGNRKRDGEGVLAALATIVLAPFASALEKIAGARDAHRKDGIEALPTSPAAAHLFIVNPLTSSGVMSLFSTHPPAEERIARLRKMVV